MAPHIIEATRMTGDRTRANTPNKTKVGKVTRKEVMDIVKVKRKT